MKDPEGRAITIARVRAGVTQKQLADRLFYTQPHIGYWERGVREPKWAELYGVLPELEEIRKNGCSVYCPKADICKKDGKCPMACAAKPFRKMESEGKTGLDRDVVAVVRCENCAHGAEGNYEDYYLCNRKMVGLMKPTDYCSYGKRRDDNA